MERGEADSIVITNYVPGTGADETTHPRAPWFVPWSPNASANGRLLILLQTNLYSVAQVAELLGYTDPGYFCKVFKKENGICTEPVKLDNRQKGPLCRIITTQGVLLCRNENTHI